MDKATEHRRRSCSDADPDLQALFAIRNRKVRKMLQLFVKLFVIVPIILFIITMVLFFNSRHKLSNYHQCTGTIVRFYETTNHATVGKDGHKAISPVVSYTVNGKSYEFIGNYCSTWMKVGQDIEVMYHTEDPSKATIKQGLYFAPMVLGALTLLFTIPIIVYLILKSKGLIHL